MLIPIKLYTNLNRPSIGGFFTRKNNENYCTTLLLAILLLMGIQQIGLLFTPFADKTPVMNKSINFPRYDSSKTLTPTNEGPITIWNRTYGHGYDDNGYSIIECADGGLVVTGIADSAWIVHGDLFLLRTDAAGNLLWRQNYGGIGYQIGRSIIEVSEGGYIIVGSESFRLSDQDIWVLRVDSSGNPLWNRSYGGPLVDEGYSIVECQNGGFAITGTTMNSISGHDDMWLIRIDGNGQPLWNNTYGGEQADGAFCLFETSDGGFILAGATRSFGSGSSDGWVVRTDRNGQHLWNITYGGTGEDQIREGIEVRLGGYAFVGHTYSYAAGFSDGWVIRTDADGTPLWNQTYGEFHQDWLGSLTELRTGGFALTGGSASYSNHSFDIWIIHTSTDGRCLWNQTYRGTNYNVGLAIIECQNGDLAVTGFTTIQGKREDIFLMRMANITGTRIIHRINILISSIIITLTLVLASYMFLKRLSKVKLRPRLH